MDGDVRVRCPTTGSPPARCDRPSTVSEQVRVCGGGDPWVQDALSLRVVLSNPAPSAGIPTRVSSLGGRTPLSFWLLVPRLLPLPLVPRLLLLCAVVVLSRPPAPCSTLPIVFTDHPMAFSLLKMYFRMVFLSLPVGLLAEDPMRQERGDAQ